MLYGFAHDPQPDPVSETKKGCHLSTPTYLQLTGSKTNTCVCVWERVNHPSQVHNALLFQSVNVYFKVHSLKHTRRLNTPLTEKWNEKKVGINRLQYIQAKLQNLIKSEQCSKISNKLKPGDAESRNVHLFHFILLQHMICFCLSDSTDPWHFLLSLFHLVFNPHFPLFAPVSSYLCSKFPSFIQLFSVCLLCLFLTH